eukprot:411753_1
MIFTINNNAKIVKPQKAQTLQPLLPKKETIKNAETELLVNGYCRSIQKILKHFNYTIPVSIIEICIKFYEFNCIINIAIGQCGNQFSSVFYKSLMDEYQLTNDGLKKNDKYSIGNTYFRQSENRFVARSLFIDLEPGTLDVLTASSTSKLIDFNRSIFGAYGAGNNWAKGFWTEGAEIIDKCMNALRKEIETYDEPQGIQFMHSLGGGTGSGLGALMMQK